MSKTALQPYLSVLVFFALIAGATAQQNSPGPTTAAANSFVQDLLSRAGTPSAVTVSFENISSLSPEGQETAQNSIMTAFREAGVRLVKPDQAMADVRITFSEDWQAYVWIAMIQQGPGKQWMMKRVPRAERALPARAPTLTVRKSSVWQQELPILDFFVDNQNLVILEPGQISAYTKDSGQWRLRSVLAVAHNQTWPRDLRGRLQVNGHDVAAFLPGTRCTGSLSQPSLDCGASDDPWPIDQGRLVAFFSTRRNFFTGILSGPRAGDAVAPFFSAAAWTSGDQPYWLFTGTDGRARLYQNDVSSPAVVFNGWGSNLAALHSGCGSGWQLLVSAPTDNLRSDTLQAVEIAGREAQTVSPAMDLPGPVAAMWTSGKNSDAVNLVMQSPLTGKYEALILTVSCN
ncbi:MAG TPA: hypothetical protein VKL40_17115 [Candidatus Angelobacter sp.]|nr:hypothetical protein [Candidatus Angelobacter sp.]